jgi:hypothetical protein
MLTAYIDESWKDGGSYFIVAGFLGGDDQWKSFATEWKKLNPDGFHAKTLRWQSDSTRVRLEKCGALPNEHGLKPLAGLVKVSDYSHFLENKFERRMMSGFSVALYPAVIGCYRSIPEDERVKWVFEEQRVYEVTAREVFASLDERIGNRIAGIEFVPKGSTCLTEPSDYLAFALLQNKLDPESLKAKWTKSILEHGCIGKEISRDDLQYIMHTIITGARLEASRSGEYQSLEHLMQRMNNLSDDSIKNHFYTRREKLRGVIPRSRTDQS